MRKTKGYILMGVNFYVDEDGNQYCEMKLTGKGETVYEKYEINNEQSKLVKKIADNIYNNNEFIS